MSQPAPPPPTPAPKPTPTPRPTARRIDLSAMSLANIEAAIAAAGTGPVAVAAEMAAARRASTARPDGSWDRARRFTPSGHEARPCCDAIRDPSWSFPFSLWAHCHSVGHVAAMHDVDRTDVLRLVRLLERRAELTVEQDGR